MHLVTCTPSGIHGDRGSVAATVAATTQRKKTLFEQDKDVIGYVDSDNVMWS